MPAAVGHHYPGLLDFPTALGPETRTERTQWVRIEAGAVYLANFPCAKSWSKLWGASRCATRGHSHQNPLPRGSHRKVQKSTFGARTLNRLRFGAHRLYRTPMAKAVLFGQNCSFEFRPPKHPNRCSPLQTTKIFCLTAEFQYPRKKKKKKKTPIDGLTSYQRSTGVTSGRHTS